MVAKGVLSYIKGTTDFGVLFPKSYPMQGKLLGFSDADRCGIAMIGGVLQGICLSS